MSVHPKLSSLDEDFKRLGLKVPGGASSTSTTTTQDPKVADLQVHKAVSAIKLSLEGAQLTQEQINKVVAEAAAAANSARSTISEAEMKATHRRYAKFKTIVGRMAKKHAKGGVGAKFKDLYPKAKNKLGAMAKAMTGGGTRMAGEDNSIASLLGDLQDVLGAHQSLLRPESNEETAAFANLAISADLLARALGPIQDGIAEMMAEGLFDEEQDGEARDSIVEMTEIVEALAELSAEFAESVKHLKLSDEDLTGLEEDFKEMLGIFMTVLEMYDEYEEDWALAEDHADDDDDDDDDDEDDKDKKKPKKKDDDEDDKKKPPWMKGKKGPFGKTA